MSNTTTKSIRIPKRLKPWEDLVLDIRELVEEAKKHGEAEDDLYEMIEDVTIGSNHSISASISSIAISFTSLHEPSPL